MFIDLVFMLKNKDSENDIDSFKENFADLISFKEKTLCLHNDNQEFNYSIQKIGKGIRLKILTIDKRTTRKQAISIESLKRAFIKNDLRREYNVVVIFDGASEYYCNNLSKYIFTFERKLRQFVYLTVLSAYGTEWTKKTLVDEEIKNDIDKNERNKNRHIEKALDHFTFQNYISYLFDEWSDSDPYNVVQEAQLALKEQESSNNIINILNKGEKISLWERLFSKRNIDLTRNSLDEIRKIRNNVVHSKEISDIEFCKYRNILKQYIKKLDIAVADFENRKHLSVTDLENVLSSYTRIIQTSGIGEYITKALSPALNEISNSLYKEAVKNISASISDMIHLDNKSFSAITEAFAKLYRQNLEIKNAKIFPNNITTPKLNTKNHLF
ncbi:hypothetical protein [Gardnerella vaginalis]|uniref:Apea-like HEPN domain-containing protein n=2 Tax=Gardnerella TaxID=2701 RepID=A0A2K1SWI7_GARVA|nr:hypothetical protein [Gardnerella vaginalis]PNS43856.1 hypothetical protein BFS05_01170 [Gardnerella vaginalis]